MKNMKKKPIINYILAILLLLNPLSHFFYNVFEIGNTYYASYLEWIILFCSMITIGHQKITKKGVIVPLILVTTFGIGAIFGELILSSGFSEWHVALFTSLSYICVLGLNYNKTKSEIDYTFLARIVLMVGIASVLYAIIFQQSYFLELIRRNNVSLNSWKFTSFFGQRNIFAQYCYLASICTLILYVNKRKKFYLIPIAIFGTIIFLTDSRAALIGFIIAVGLYVCLNKKNKYVFMLLTVSVVLSFAYAFNVFDQITTVFFHQAADGNDSGAIRIFMWLDCIKFLFEKNAMVFGLGIGAESVFLIPKYGVGSSHSVYFDALFNGGIIYLSVIIISLYQTTKSIVKIGNKKIKNVFIAFMISFIFYGFVEAGMALFGSNYFSITASILLIIIPQLLVEKEIYEQK